MALPAHSTRLAMRVVSSASAAEQVLYRLRLLLHTHAAHAKSAAACIVRQNIHVNHVIELIIQNAATCRLRYNPPAIV